MKAAITRLLHRFDREVIERQIEEELRFHLDRLTEQHLQQDMSLAKAKDAALERFGSLSDSTQPTISAKLISILCRIAASSCRGICWRRRFTDRRG